MDNVTSIVHHRRGLLTDWQAQKLIPEDGELVLEEITNVLTSKVYYRCKIGNGIDTFKNLPYIGDDIKVDVEKLLNTKISSLYAELKGLYETANENFEDLSDTLTNEETGILAAINTATSSLNAYKDVVSKDIAAVDQKIPADLTTTWSQIKEAIAKLNMNVENSELSAKLAGIAVNAKAIEDLEKELRDLIAAEKSAIEEDIDDVDEKLTENLSKVVDLYTTSTVQLSNFITVLSKHIKEAREELDSVSADLQKKQTDQNTTILNLKTQLLGFTTQLSLIENRVTSLETRLSGIVAATGGLGNADIKDVGDGYNELTDIRRGYNGNIYPIAGDAVRALGLDLEALRKRIPEHITENAANGLLYENNTLYLTANGNKLGDGVEIVGGGGGGAGAAAGSYVTVSRESEQSITVAMNKPANISFKYASFERGETPVPTSGQGLYRITINGAAEIKSDIINHGDVISVDVSKYLTPDMRNTVLVTCTDPNGATGSVTFFIYAVDLRLISNFKSSTLFSDSFDFACTVFGDVDKDLYVFIDDTRIEKRRIVAGRTNVDETIKISKQSHGSHVLTAYLEAIIGEDTIRSDALTYDITCISSDGEEPIVTLNSDTLAVTYGDIIPLTFMIYDPLKDEDAVCKASLKTYTHISGTVTELSSIDLDAGRQPGIFYVMDYPTTGDVWFKLVYNYTDKTGNDKCFAETRYPKAEDNYITVSPMDVGADTMQAETDQLRLYLTAANKSNEVSNKDTWTFKDNNNNIITAEFIDFNWETNGWITEAGKDTCLRLNGDARAIINFAPLTTVYNNAASDPVNTGATFEIEFAVRDANTRDTTVISCVSQQEYEAYNLIEAGDFETVNSGWALTENAAEAVSGGVSGKALKLNKTDDAIAAKYVVPYLDANTSYELSFSAKSADAASNNELEIKIATKEDDADLLASTVAFKVSDLTTEYKQYSFNVASEAASKHAIAFINSASEGAVLIDDLSLKSINTTIVKRGFTVTPDNIKLRANSTAVSYQYKDEERVRATVVIEPKEIGDKPGTRFVSMYIDGVLSNTQCYPTSERFSSDGFITLGSDKCGLDVYSIRAYNKALTPAQVLKNYIADCTIPAEKKQLIVANAITNNKADGSTEISYTKVKELGQIPIVLFTGEMPTYKGDKRTNVKMSFYDPAHPELNFENELLDSIDVQGTSSQYYVRKNWKIKTKSAKRHMPNAMPAKVFCIKVDYAEATGTHNTGTANFVETLYDKVNHPVPPQRNVSSNTTPELIRSAIQGFPCLIFERKDESDPNPVFSSKGNFNYDKGAEDVFGFNDINAKKYGVECWEFCNNTSEAVNFTGEIPQDWAADFEPRFTSYDFDTIEELRDKAKEKTITDDERIQLNNLQDQCISNFKVMHDWVLSTDTNQATNEPLKDDEGNDITVTYGTETFDTDTVKYRERKFIEEFTDYFDMHWCCIYYIYTLFALMTDQRAKNMFLTYWLDTDADGAVGTTGHWYPYFYDNDTIFGINNEGALVFDYFHEDIDKVGSTNVYNGQNSVLWNNFRQHFATQIKETYQTLRTSKKLTYEKLLDAYVTNGSDKYSAAVYNADAEYKYISFARPNEKGEANTKYLYQVRGTGEQHLRYFLSNRFDYCDSKWEAATYKQSDEELDNVITLRINTPDNIVIGAETKNFCDTPDLDDNGICKKCGLVHPSSKIKMVPFSNMYAGVKYGAEGNFYNKRLAANEPWTAEHLGTEVYDENGQIKGDAVGGKQKFNDTETYIYGARNISELTDLSNLYCHYINVAGATKLMKLVVGNKDENYRNVLLDDIALGSNRLLQVLDIRNCSKLAKTLDLKNCPNIKEIYATGTSIPGIDLPTGGYLTKLHLPGTLNTLTIQNQALLGANADDFKIESCSGITILTIENCPKLNSFDILSNVLTGAKVERTIRLTDVDWTKANIASVTDSQKLALFDKLLELRELFPAAEVQITGKCSFDTLSGAEYTRLRKAFPSLRLIIGALSSSIIFNYTTADGNVVAQRHEFTRAHDSATPAEWPSLPELGAPYKAADSYGSYVFTDVWNSWSETAGGVALVSTALHKLAGEVNLYPVFTLTPNMHTLKYVNATYPEDHAKYLVLEESKPYGTPLLECGPSEEVELTLIKGDTKNPDIFEFTYWRCTNCGLAEEDKDMVDQDLIFEACFDLSADSKRVISTADVNYSVNTSNKIVISGAKLSPAETTGQIITVPEQFMHNSKYLPITEVSLATGNRNTSLEYPILELSDYVQVIGVDCCAYNTELYEVTLPKNLTTIKANAFNCTPELLEITIPASVSVIEDNAFGNYASSATAADGVGAVNRRITVEEGNEVFETLADGALVTKDHTRVIYVPSTCGQETKDLLASGSLSRIPDFCFAYSDIDNATISLNAAASDNEIGEYSFRNAKLNSIKLNDVAAIRWAAFWCETLTSVEFSNNLEVIEGWAFYAARIPKLILPSSLKTVGIKAFSNNSALEEVIFKTGSKINSIDRQAFDAITHKVTITFEDSLSALSKTVISEDFWSDGSTSWAPTNCVVKFGNGEITYSRVNGVWQEKV